MTMDSITGSPLTNSVFIAGNNNINTSTDVMATRNMAQETAVAQGDQKVQTQDSMAADVDLPVVSSQDPNLNDFEVYPEEGSQVNISA